MNCEWCVQKYVLGVWFWFSCGFKKYKVFLAPWAVDFDSLNGKRSCSIVRDQSRSGSSHWPVLIFVAPLGSAALFFFLSPSCDISQRTLKSLARLTRAEVWQAADHTVLLPLPLYACSNPCCALKPSSFLLVLWILHQSVVAVPLALLLAGWVQSARMC